MSLKLGTFNAENLFMRYKFDSNTDPKKFCEEGGRITDLGCKIAYDAIEEQQRKNTAQVILANDPDVICLQEIENLETLKKFNRDYLNKKYRYGVLIDGNDPRQIDVGILSKNKLEIAGAWSHQYDRDQKGVIFSRDCLEANILSDKGENLLTLFVNHLKSKAKGTAAATGEKRQRQATRIAEILQERYGSDIENANFAVVGDFNDTPNSQYLEPLLCQTCLENVVQRLPEGEQWTYSMSKNKKEQIDYILLSKQLADNNKNASPKIERQGLRDKITAYTGPRFTGVGPDGTEASDHCAVFIEIDI